MYIRRANIFTYTHLYIWCYAQHLCSSFASHIPPVICDRKQPCIAMAFSGSYIRSFCEESQPEPLLGPRSSNHKHAKKRRLRGKTCTQPDIPSSFRQRLLPAFVQCAVSSLNAAARRALRSSFPIGPEPVVLTVGTACSGSELYLTALPLLQRELGRLLGKGVRFVHMWSCEKHPAKRAWIVDNFHPPKLFGDITRLADAGGCYDYMSQALQKVDPVDILIAGTSCKDASRLNPHHADRLNAVDARTHSTGSTFSGLMELVRKLSGTCRLVFLENVTSLGDRDRATGRSNLDGVADAMRGAGYMFVCRAFSAEDMGLPVCRPRLYMAGSLGACETSSQSVADQIIDGIVAVAPRLHLDMLLLPEYEPLLMMQDWLPDAMGREAAYIPASTPAAWEEEHLQQWAGVPDGHIQQVAQELGPNVWARSLSARQRDLLTLTLSTPGFSRHGSAGIALNKSLGWSHQGTAGRLHTLVPGSVYWMVQRNRLLTGVEALRLQGCDISDLEALQPGKYKSAFLQDLAGNAFCVYQFVAWFLACLVTTDFGHRV